MAIDFHPSTELSFGGVAKRVPQRGGARPGAGRKRVVHDPVRLAVDFERSDIERLDKVAARRGGASLASLVREAVRDFVRRKSRR